MVDRFKSLSQSIPEAHALLTKEKNGRSYHLKLTQRGENAFVVCHQVFIDWDAQSLGGLTAQERQQLLTLLQTVI